ncbi:MAG: N-acetylmuramoyl-L-alanine amidase [Nocardioides sp.]
MGSRSVLSSPLAACGATALLIAGLGHVPASGTSPRPLQLHPVGRGVVHEAEVPLGQRLHPVRGGTRTARLPAETFSMIGFTWYGADPGVAFRTRSDRGWSSWLPAPELTHGSTDGAASEPIWVDDARALQVRTEARNPRGLRLVLIDPGALPEDSSSPSTSSTATPTTLRATSLTAAPMPDLRQRRHWGANPDWRNGEPVYLDRLKQIHVHHTATGNSYSRTDVPGILRGMYRYHTHTLGWFDIGYNFLVDRFGRAWVGRSGGPQRLVRGAHTLGFNHASVGVAMIGNLENRGPWREAVTMLVKVAAWKLDKHDRFALGRVNITSSGSDRYRDGERVRLPAIDGHRDTNYTACPGQRLYGNLPEIRERTQRRIDRF